MMDVHEQMTATRLGAQAMMLQQEVEYLIDTAPPELVRRLFGGGDPSHLVADLGALIANADRILGNPEAE